MTEKKLEWREGQEKRQYAYNDANDELGYLYLTRVGAHTHWCWVQDSDYHMSPGCLEEVRLKQKELFSQRKNKNDTK